MFLAHFVGDACCDCFLTAQIPIPVTVLLGRIGLPAWTNRSPGDSTQSRSPGFFNIAKLKCGGRKCKSLLSWLSASLYHCRDRASPCRRRGCGGRAYRRSGRRNHYRSRSRRPTLLLSITRIRRTSTVLLLDARRAGMGRLSSRVDLSQHQSLRVGFHSPSTCRLCSSHISSTMLVRLLLFRTGFIEALDYRRDFPTLW